MNTEEILTEKETSDEEMLTLRDTLLVLGLVFLLYVTLGSILQYYYLIPGVYITEWIIILLPSLLLLKIKNKNISSILKLKNFTAKNLLTGVLGGVAIFIISIPIALIVQEILGPHPSNILVENVPSSILGFIPWFFGLGVSAGICEEMMFRGFLQNGLSEKWEGLTVVVIAAALFSLFHLDPWRLVTTFLLGLTAGYLMLKTDSLLTPITLHITNNSIALILAFATTTP